MFSGIRDCAIIDFASSENSIRSSNHMPNLISCADPNRHSRLAHEKDRRLNRALASPFPLVFRCLDTLSNMLSQHT